MQLLSLISQYYSVGIVNRGSKILSKPNDWQSVVLISNNDSCNRNQINFFGCKHVRGIYYVLESPIGIILNWLQKIQFVSHSHSFIIYTVTQQALCYISCCSACIVHYSRNKIKIIMSGCVQSRWMSTKQIPIIYIVVILSDIPHQTRCVFP